MYKVYKSLIQSLQDIKLGKVGVIPTDTLYGLVASVNHPEAIHRVYALKSREQKPGTLIADSINQLVDLGLKRRYLLAVERYWPGAVSVIIPTGQNLEYLHQGKYSLAIRIPDNKELRRLLGQTGPLLTTSANMSGEHPANNIVEAQQIFEGKVDFYVDGGPILRQPSTVIRIIDDAVEILRHGKVKINEQNGEIIA